MKLTNVATSPASSFGLLDAGAHLDGRRERLAQVGGELLRRRSARGGGRDGVELAHAVEQPLCGPQVEDGEGRAAERVDARVLRDADDLEPLERRERGDADPVSDLVALVVRGARVDDDFVGPVRPAAVLELERVEARDARVDAEPEGRRVARDRLAVLVEDLDRGLLDDTAGGRVDGRARCAPARGRSRASAAPRPTRPRS